MRKRRKIVVTGYIGLLPAGGVTWDYIQYPLGLRELGHEVLYLEDTLQWPVYQDSSGECRSASSVKYLAAAMGRFGMEGNWAYRDVVSGECFGMTEDAVRRFCAAADVLINVSCSTPLREEYAAIPIRVLLDTDPMFTQVQAATGKGLYGGCSSLPEMMVRHTHHFTFGENVGGPGCEVPSAGWRWFRTRQPVVLKHWPKIPLPGEGAFTSVFNWSAARELEFCGRKWGQKNTEFMRFLHIPEELMDLRFTIAIGQTTDDPFPAEAAKKRGWCVLSAQAVAPDMASYQRFIHRSRAEFSVAKHTYVQANTGWFSCRSACYLASGRPVVTQDTGWSAFLPNGAGLFAFSDSETALAALREIERNPEPNASAAREIAEEVFDSNKVLRKMLAEVGV